MNHVPKRLNEIVRDSSKVDYNSQFFNLTNIIFR